MTVQVLLAPAGRGKTAYVIDAVRALPPLSPTRILVPDHVEAAAFRRRLAQAGGVLGAEVQTFYDLYADVLALIGGTLPLSQELGEGEGWGGGEGLARLPSTVRTRLIEHLVETLCDAGQLGYYTPLRGSPGFARLLGELFGEFKRARIFPEELERVLAVPPQSPLLAGGMSRRDRGGLIELARLYTAYQDWLLQTGWVDADGQGWLAAIALEQNPPLLADLSLLAVDGFDEFNPTQLYLLRLLAGRAETVLVTLTGDPQNPDRLAHRRFARARAALVETLGVEPASLSLVSSSSPPLVHLEQNIFEPNALAVSADGAVAFLEAQDRATEAREALRWLKARVVRDGVSPSDTAIVARDVGPYRPFLAEAAAEFGMPQRFVSGSDLRANPAVSALLNLLTLSVEPLDWSPRILLDMLTSPYFDWTGCGLGLDDPGRLLDLARAGQVVGKLDQWREAFRASESVSQQLVEDEDEGMAPRKPPTGEEAARLADVFEAIVAWVTPSSQATLREYVAWIEDLIGEDPALAGRNPISDRNRVSKDDASLHVVTRARENATTAERDVAALRALKDILRGLVLADAVLRGRQDQILPYSQFVAGLVQAVQNAAYAVPVEGEATLVASALEVRGLAFDSVALLGLAEGEFPQAEREDALLRESDRAWLAERGFAIEPRLRGDEVTFFYQAVTRARRHLLLCRPYLADDGQPWEPSPYWSAARDLVDSPVVRHVRPADPVEHPASELELRSASSELSTVILQARAQAALSPWTGDLSPLRELLEQRFGSNRPWSSSRLETYAKCPFYFWAAYAMDLEPRELPKAGFDVLTLGSIYHLVLERLYNRVPDGDPDRLRDALPVVAQEVYDAAPNDYGFRPSPLWERQQEEMTNVLRRTVEALIEIAEEYAPLMQELSFGLGERPVLVLPGEPPLRLRGYIDRVDRAPDGKLRVIDYKAGSTPITARDLTEGQRLQLPLYALAAEQVLGAEVAGGFYWHIGAAKPSSLRLEKYKNGVVGAVDAAVEYALSIGAAVCDGQFAPQSLDAGCPAFCPAVAFCERYKPRLW
jgi:ATP-dependent helicase/nuclease subunit B